MIKLLILGNFASSGKYGPNLSLEKVCMGWQYDQVLNMSARIANISEVKVLNKFAWGSKCDQTLAIERVCSRSGITIIIKVQVLTNFASGGKMC